LTTIARFAFGNTGIPAPAGWVRICRVYRSPRFLWLDNPREGWQTVNPDPLLAGYNWGQEAEFRLGLPAGEYQLSLTFFDPTREHGPFSLSAASVPARAPQRSGAGTTLLESLIVPRGEVVRRQVTISHTGGALALRFVAAPGRTFLVSNLTVDGPASASLQVLFPDAPADILPTPEEVLAEGRDDPAAALREICEWLLRQRRPDGFLGDQEGQHRWWYTTSFPIRVFLAASTLLHEPRYVDAATTILDRLIVQQLPTGAWTQGYRDQPTAQMSAEAIAALPAHHNMNLADVGSIVAALASACRYVDPARAMAYQAAVRRYCDGWALNFQLVSGAFTNAWVVGGFARAPYGVSTATTAMTLSFLTAVSGDTRYLQRAEAAAEFMVTGWHPAGAPYWGPYDTSYPGRPWYQPAWEVGDLYYLLEGIVAVDSHSANAGLHYRVREALRRYYLGTEGIAAAWGTGPWLPITDAWHNSKSAGIPMFSQYLLQSAGSEDLTAAERATLQRMGQLARRFLSTPRFSRLIGVMVEDPPLPWGGHSMGSWTNSSLAATGFAALSLCEMLRPGITRLVEQ
jgi:hypothetical protein